MNTKLTIALTSTILACLTSPLVLAGDGGIAERAAESKVYLLQGEELAQYYISHGKATAAGPMENSSMMKKDETNEYEGLTAAQRKRLEVGNDH